MYCLLLPVCQNSNSNQQQPRSAPNLKGPTWCMAGGQSTPTCCLNFLSKMGPEPQTWSFGWEGHQCIQWPKCVLFCHLRWQNYFIKSGTNWEVLKPQDPRQTWCMMHGGRVISKHLPFLYKVLKASLLTTCHGQPKFQSSPTCQITSNRCAPSSPKWRLRPSKAKMCSPWCGWGMAPHSHLPLACVWLFIWTSQVLSSSIFKS